jgi:hypothetical protein
LEESYSSFGLNISSLMSLTSSKKPIKKNARKFPNSLNPSISIEILLKLSSLNAALSQDNR